MSEQPEALRLADALDAYCTPQDVAEQAAAELRVLHEENQRCKQVCAATAEWWRVERDALLGVLKNIERSTYDAKTAALARAAIAKVEGNT